VLKQTLQVVFDEIDSHKSAISFLTFFEEAIQATQVVEPSKASFNFPPLTAVALLVFILRRSSRRHRYVITAIGSIRHDPAFPKLLSEWFAVITFIEAQAFRTPESFANLNAIYRFEYFTLVVPVGFRERKVERVAIGINDQVAFYAVNTVFS